MAMNVSGLRDPGPFRVVNNYLRSLTAIEQLRAQRKPTTTTKPAKVRTVTDEQLLAIVEELHSRIDTLQGRVDLNNRGINHRVDQWRDSFMRRVGQVETAVGNLGPLARWFGVKP